MQVKHKKLQCVACLHSLCMATVLSEHLLQEVELGPIFQQLQEHCNGFLKNGTP